MILLSFIVSDFIVKQLYVGAHLDRLRSVNGELSSQTSGRLIISVHPKAGQPLMDEVSA